MSDDCKDKFLKGAPDSETAYYIRKERGLAQPWTAIRDFGGDDDENYADDHNIKLRIKIPSGYSVVHPNVNGERKLVLSKKEKEILNDCNNCSNYIFSLPLSVLCGAFMFGAQKKGWISDLNETNSKWTKKLPKLFPFRSRTFHGILLGYIVGQLIYLNSDDCADRFLKQAPDGQVAKHIQKMIDEESYVENQDKFVDYGKAYDTKPENDKLEELLQIDPYVNMSYLADYSDISSIDWFGENDIEIPEKYKK